MKRTTAVLAVLCATSLTALAAGAQAATNPRYDGNRYNGDHRYDSWGNWYAGISGDLTWMNHTNTGGGGNVALGYRLWTGDIGDVRLEGEVGYHAAPNKSNFSGNTRYFSYMANAYYDLTTFRPWQGGPWSGNGWHLVPYVGGGIGDATVHSGHRRNAFGNEIFSFNSSNNSFAYDLMAGLTLVSDRMPNTDWSLGYRYLATTSSTGSISSLHSNNLELGLRFHF